MKLKSNLLAKAAGLECLDTDVLARLESYADLLIEANQKINLISRSVDLNLEIQNQIALSIIPDRLIPRSARRWIDIGSGGGFPVVPLAVLRPETHFTAIEQIAKKAYFIERTAQTLGITNLKVLATSIEHLLISESSPAWDVVSIKAVTETEESLRWSAGLIVTGGVLVTYKPTMIEPEIETVLRRHDFKHKASLNVKELIDKIDVRVVVYEKL